MKMLTSLRQMPCKAAFRGYGLPGLIIGIGIGSLVLTEFWPFWRRVWELLASISPALRH